MSFLTANGITLHYAWDAVQTGTPLVFVNALGTDLHLWDALIPCLPPRFRLLRYDKRGHGLSDTPPAPYSLLDHTRDLATLVEQLEIETSILIGISVGGLIALDYAGRHPDRVRALVLCDTTPRIGTPDGWAERIRSVREQGLANMAGTLLGRWFAPTFSARRPADFQGFANMLRQTPVEGYLGTCAALRDADLHEGLARIKIPSLVLCGMQDISTPPELVRQLAEALPDARFQGIEAAAHLPCVEQPEAMAAAINPFLQELEHV